MALLGIDDGGVVILAGTVIGVFTPGRIKSPSSSSSCGSVTIGGAVVGGVVTLPPGSTGTVIPGGVGGCQEPSGFVMTVSSRSDQTLSPPPCDPSGEGR